MSVTTEPILRKAPFDERHFHWNGDKRLPAGVTVSQVLGVDSVIVDSTEASDLVVESAVIDPVTERKVQVTVKGGTAGREYRVRFDLQLSDGQKVRRTGRLTVAAG